jgi:N-acetylglutamate synthase
VSLVRISVADLGRRVVARRLLPDGRASDVVGELVDLDDESLSVLPDAGPVVRLALRDLVAAKPVPARRALPSSSPEALERVMALGWPGLETARLGGWLLRAAGGFTRRANSALTAGDSGVPLDAALDAVRSFYADRGLPPSVQVVVPLPGDRRWEDPHTLEALEDRGWRRDAPTVVMTLDVRRLPAARPVAGVTVHWADAPDDAWLELYRYHGSPVPPVARKVLTAAPHQAFASLRVDDVPVAVGRVAVATGWAGITAMQVADGYQRRGLARALLAEMLRRGREEGARFAYLQVLASNEAAIGLYSSAGFRPHHAYHYLSPPS